MKFSQKIKNRSTIMIQQFHFWIYAQKKEKQDFDKIYVSPRLLHHYSQ